MNKSG